MVTTVDQQNPNGIGEMNDENGPRLQMCILGGGGYLGQSLAKALQKNGHFVVILDLQFQNFSNLVLNPSKLRFVQGSILDPVKLTESLECCDACFHLAGYGMSGGASLNREMTFLVNYTGTRAVLAACRRLGVARLLYASSVSVVFHGEDLHYSDENEPYARQFANPYAETKCLAEKEVIAASFSNQKDDNDDAAQFSTCALRFRGIYGPGELRTTQRTVNLSRRGLTIVKFCKSNSPRTQYSSVENCVNAFILAEKSLRVGVTSLAHGQIYNIVDGGEPVDTFGFWEPLLRAVGGKTSKVYVPFKLVYALGWLFEALYYLFGVEPLFTRFEANLMAITNTFSIEKACRDLGYHPVRNHDLGTTIAFTQQQLQQARILTPQSSVMAITSSNSSSVSSANADSLPALLKGQLKEINFAAMLVVAQICATLFADFTPLAKIFANLAIIAIYFAIVAIRNT